MLKKAGIVVAAAAAGLLAVSPLAFAGDKGHDDHGDYSYSESSEVYEDNDAATNDSGVLSGNNVSAPINVCNNDVSGSVAGGAVNDVTGAIAGAASLLGDAAAAAEAEDNEVRDCSADSDIDDNGSATTED